MANLIWRTRARGSSGGGILLVTLILAIACNAEARAGDVIVQLPEGASAKSAQALAPSKKPGEDGPGVDGEAKGKIVTFSRLEMGTAYDLKITLADGTVLHGVNMGWYTEEPAKAGAGPLTDDDREQMRALVSDVVTFTNINRIIQLAGDHNRATVLVERIRSSAFHSDSGGEVIWRVELWYFKNHFGGWNELTQTNKVLRRERFKGNEEYKAAVDNLRWVPALGGVVMEKGGANRTISVTPEMLKPAEEIKPPSSDGGPAATQPAGP